MAGHDRSTDGEIRDILEKAARPEGRIRLGSLPAAIGREAGLTTTDVEGHAAAARPNSCGPHDIRMILPDTNLISEPWKPRPDPHVVAWIDAQAVETLFCRLSQWPSCV
jgi:plasmid stability protein